MALLVGLLLARIPAVACLAPLALAGLALRPALRVPVVAALSGLLIGSAGHEAPLRPGGFEGLALPAIHQVEGTVRSADPPTSRGRRLVLDLARLGEAPDHERSVHAPGGREPDGHEPAGRVAVRLTLGPGPFLEVRPGDRIRAIARLQGIRGKRNPGQGDLRAREARRGVFLRGYVARPAHLERLARGGGLLGALDAARTAGARRFDALLGPGDAGLARALVLGDRGTLRDADRARLRASGQAHLVAVSGLHVGLLLAGLLALLGRLGLPPRLVAGVGLVGVLLYVPFAGAAPSAVRAGLAGALWLLGRMIGRTPRGLTLLAAVATGVLLVDPAALHEASFSLSFAAALGILTLAGRLRALLVPAQVAVPGLLPRRRAPVRTALAVALAAWLATTPLCCAVLGRLAPLGAPLSLLAVPLASALVGLGFLILAASPVPVLGDLLAAPFGLVAEALRHVLDVAGTAPVGARGVAPPPVAWHLAWGAALLALVAGGRRLSLLALGLLGALLGVALLGRPSPPAVPRLWLLDVGHGQAALLLLPDGRAALLDAGSLGAPQAAAATVRAALGALGVRTLEIAAASHGDADHAGALEAVAREVPVARAVLPAQGAGQVARALAGLGVAVSLPHDGEVLLEGAWGRLEIVAAGAPPGTRRSKNDASIVLRVRSASGRTLLLPGDRELDGVSDLIDAGADLGADVLVLPHHGLPGEGLDRLVAACGAQVHLASCGSRALPLLPPGTLSTAGAGALRVDLEEAGARVAAPYREDEGGRPARRGRYDPRPPMPLASPSPPGDGGWLVPALLLLFAVASVRPLGWLTPAASAAAWVLGLAAWAAFGLPGLAALLAPFVVATVLGRLPGARREGPRSLLQVACNGGPALLGALLVLLAPPGPLPRAGLLFFLGSLAGLGADTSATEVGVRLGRRPRRLHDLRRVPAGESGGVSLPGLLAAVAGAFLAPGAWLLLERPEGIDGLALLGTVAGAGVAGALLDSLVGGTIQYRGRDLATGRVVEHRRVGGAPTVRVSGLSWLDNDVVNLICALGAGLAAVAFAGAWI